MRTRTDNVLDVVAGGIIALTIFVLVYTASHLYALADQVPTPEPTPAPIQLEHTPAKWSVVSCDHTKSAKHRAPCGLVLTESLPEEQIDSIRAKLNNPPTTTIPRG